MKCEEFRRRISESDSLETDLEQHLSGCHECESWLQLEVATPPEGLTPAQWQEATARCFPEKLPEPKPEVKEQSFWEFYLNGFKYGMVFGLSLITGFALLEFIQPAPDKDHATGIEMSSFVDQAETVMPVFFENDFSTVTFVDSVESNLVSFVADEQLPDFYEHQEDEKWTENSG